MASGRNRVLVNRQPLKRARDLLGVLRVTVFAPDDLELAKGGPAERRRYLDDALVASHPRYDALRGEVDKILKQRNALLKGAGGRLDDEAAFTLDVWDAKLAESGGRLAEARQALLARLAPALAETYDAVANRPAEVTATYAADWADAGLEAALAASRHDDLRRGVSTVGPHRDDVDLRIGGLPARTHASQGEQRSLALALRLASHHVITDDHRQRAGPPARRRLLRARPGPQRRAARQPAAGPDAPHQRQRPPAEGPARPRAPTSPTAASGPADPLRHGDPAATMVGTAVGPLGAQRPSNPAIGGAPRGEHRGPLEPAVQPGPRGPAEPTKPTP